MRFGRLQSNLWHNFCLLFAAIEVGHLIFLTSPFLLT